MAKIRVSDDYESMSKAASAIIRDTIKEKPRALICFAAGDTPLRTVQLAAEGLKHASYNTGSFFFAGLDEWVGIPPGNTGSCQYFFRRYWLDPLNVSPNRYHMFNACSTNLRDECMRMDEWIRLCGDIDLAVVGVGMNGHIGFNEPGLPWDLRSHVATLDETTKTVGQKYFREQTNVTQGITIGLGWLKKARRVVLLASGEKKAAVVKLLCEGPVTSQVPASILQTLPQAEILLDRAAASALTEKQAHEME